MEDAQRFSVKFVFVWTAFLLHSLDKSRPDVLNCEKQLVPANFNILVKCFL